MNEALRSTGRTTRLVEQACQLAYQRRAVYILVLNSAVQDHVERRVEDTWSVIGRGLGGHGIKVEVLNSHDHPHWDWFTMKLKRAHPNVEVLLEHTLVEHRIEVLQSELKAIATEIGRLYPLTV